MSKSGLGGRALGAWLGAVALLLALPSTEYALFDGLPASALPEFLAVATLVPFAVSRELRHDAHALLGRLPRLLRRLILVAPVGLLAIKVALLIGAPSTGFEACYQTLDVRPPVGSCESSYENLTRGADGATRIDSAIDFGPRGSSAAETLADTDWNLSFLNDKRFNDYGRPNAPRYRLRLPLDATWRGHVEVASGDNVRVTYVGQGSIGLGAATTQLVPAYARARTTELHVPSGRHVLRLAYRFAEPPGRRESPAGRPYAQIRMDRVTGGAAEPLRAAPPPALVAIGARAADVGIAALVLLLAGIVVLTLRGAWSIVALTVAAALILRVLPGGFVSTPAVRTAAASVVLLGLIALRRPARPVLVGYVALLGVAAAHVLPDLHSWGSVLYRTPGDDWLTYESQARAILDHHSLEGGEAIFNYQAAFRYVVFLEHAIWGDGDAAHAIMALTAMGVGALAVLRVAGFAPTRTRLAIQLGAAAAVLGLLATDPVRGAAETGLSEYPTWIVLPVVIWVVLRRPMRPAPWILAAAGVGIMVLLRMNQAFGAAIVFAALVSSIPRDRARLRVAMVALPVAALVMIPAHNVIYGGKLVLTPTSGTIAANVVIPLHDLPSAVTDPVVRRKLAHQVTALFYLPPGAPFQRGIAPFYWALLAAWLATIGWVVRRRIRLTLAGYLLLAVPLGYLLPHVSYVVLNYYPRHITIGYLAMGYATIAVLGLRLHRAPASRP